MSHSFVFIRVWERGREAIEMPVQPKIARLGPKGPEIKPETKQNPMKCLREASITRAKATKPWQRQEWIFHTGIFFLKATLVSFWGNKTKNKQNPKETWNRVPMHL